MITIRQEQPEDIDAVHRVNELAFPGSCEAGLVDTLRSNCPDHLSLVADVDGDVAGHILFTPALIKADGKTIVGMGLAPMAVHPDHQRRGFGSLLVRDGIERLKGEGCPFVIVLGHPEYYPRFGFELACDHGIGCQWDGVPSEAFMVLVLEAAEMKGVSGTAYYRPEFNEFA